MGQRMVLPESPLDRFRGLHVAGAGCVRAQAVVEAGADLERRRHKMAAGQVGVPHPPGRHDQRHCRQHRRSHAGMCYLRAAEYRDNRRGDGREQDPTGANQRRRPGGQPGRRRQDERFPRPGGGLWKRYRSFVSLAENGWPWVPWPRLRGHAAFSRGINMPTRAWAWHPTFRNRNNLVRSNPKAKLKEHQRGKRGIAEHQRALGNRFGIECRKRRRRGGRPRAEQLTRQPPDAGDGHRAKQCAFDSRGKNRLPRRRQPEHRRQQEWIARARKTCDGPYS